MVNATLSHAASPLPNTTYGHFLDAATRVLSAGDSKLQDPALPPSPRLMTHLAAPPPASPHPLTRAHASFALCSPESDTTVVPVALRKSSEVDMVGAASSTGVVCGVQACVVKGRSARSSNPSARAPGGAAKARGAQRGKMTERQQNGHNRHPVRRGRVARVARWRGEVAGWQD